MKKFLKYLLFQIVLISTVYGQDDVEFIYAGAHAFNESLIKKDTATINTIVASDFVFIHSNDWKETKTEFFKDLFDPNKAIYNDITYTGRDISIGEIEKDKKKMTSYYSVKGTYQGKKFELILEFSDIWELRNGKWWMISRKSRETK